jgi:hypothetical protein
MDYEKTIEENIIMDYDKTIIEEIKKIIPDKNADDFRIKDWKSEYGGKIHPLLKDSPIANLGVEYSEGLSKLEKEILEFEKKSIEKGEFYNVCSQDGSAEKGEMHNEPGYTEVLIPQKSDLGKKIYEVLSPIKNTHLGADIALVRFIANSNPEKIQTSHWHMDAADDKHTRLMVYLVDVENENDGPFEYVENPENHYYDAFTLSPLGINIGQWLYYENKIRPHGYFIDNEKLPTKQLYGKKFTTFIFSPFFPHKGNVPVYKDRLALIMNIPSLNAFNKDI